MPGTKAPELLGAYAPVPRYTGVQQTSHYIAMRDGVKIAVEVWLPANLAPGERIPTLLSQTRYWRATKLKNAMVGFPQA